MFAATQQIASVAGLRATKVQVKFARGRFVFSSSLKMKISNPFRFFCPIAMRIITLNEKTRLRTYAYERERTMICARVNAKKLDPSHSFVRSFDRAKERERESEFEKLEIERRNEELCLVGFFHLQKGKDFVFFLND